MPLSWFRRPKAEVEQAPSAAAVPTVEPEPLTAVEVPAEQETDGQSTATRKRRRGSRGGRGRKKGTTAVATVSTADGAGAEVAVEPSTRGGRATAVAEKPERAEKSQAAQKKQADRKAREPRTRAPRRTPPRRAPLPKAKRELLISVDAGEKRVAVLEDDIVAEVYLERPEQRSIAGNIYLGTVDNVLPGMEAAFVEIGLEKNGFLYVDEIVGPELEGRRGARKIQDLIQRGQTILVQAVKDPMKTKGARLTTEISLPGRFVVYVPQGDGLGVSRRLEDDERSRLKAIVKEIAPETGGVIVRTAAEGASAEDVERDLEFLRRLWETIEAAAKKAKAPSLIYQEAELPLRVTRDLFTGDFERLIVDHDRTHKRIVGYLKKTSPHMVDRVTRYKEREPLLETFGVEQEIRSTLNRRVDLPSGGYLIFDYAEAFTVIDVNTGRFVGSRSKREGAGRLEDTITKNNLEAVKEVVRQLRLRDVGGIIVIDFIDMANPKNRQQVEDALRQELERDRTKTYVVEISPLGLVEMTRQNVTDGPREVMTRKCPTCNGDGIVVSEGTTAVEIERRLRGLVTPGSRAKAFKIELNSKIAALLVGPDGSRLHELEEITKRRFFFVGVDDVHIDHMRVLDQGTVEKLAPAAPFEPGEELELKLGEVGLHDSRAGVGKLKGIEVVVAGAGKLVGKKVKVRLLTVMEGTAYAVLAEGADGAAGPITAEAEAERPTRPVKRAAKAAEAAPSVGEEAPAGPPPAVAARPVAAPGAKPSKLEAAKAIMIEYAQHAEDWVALNEIHEALGSQISEGMFGRLKSELKIPHRRVKNADGKAQTDWNVGVLKVGAAEAAASVLEPGQPPEAGGGAAPAKARQESRRPRKPAAGAAEPLVEGEIETEPVGGEATEGEGGEGQPAPAKKRTRRGTRGGRNRKRKPAVTVEGAESEGATEAIEPEPVSAESEQHGDGEPQAPVIHLPGRDLGLGESGNGDHPSAPRSSSRRGTRGGRNRRRKPAVAGAVGETGASPSDHGDLDGAVAVHLPADEIAPPARARKAAPKLEPEPAAAVETKPADSSDEWEYTPMSEWDRD